MTQGYQYLLVVDDNAGIRRLLFSTFSDDGYIVEMAASGFEAIQKVRSRVPLLVLLGDKIPGITGFEMLKEIKNIAPTVPVIVMTAYGEMGTQEEALKYGARWCVTKPFDLNILRRMVSEILAGKKGMVQGEKFNEIVTI